MERKKTPEMKIFQLQPCLFVSSKFPEILYCSDCPGPSLDKLEDCSRQRTARCERVQAIHVDREKRERGRGQDKNVESLAKKHSLHDGG